MLSCQVGPSPVVDEGPRTFTAASPWGWRALAALLIVGTAVLRLVYLASDCPLDLAPDEAHYWEWSRHLDWSYYSKGPLVAYLIRGGCVVAGGLSERWCGSEMMAVRLPAVLCGSLLLLSLYVLAVQVHGRERLALAVVALALTLPLMSAGASLMTIDAPYTCCWGWALVAGYRAIFRGSTWAWPAAGLLIAIGILAKYTMVLWLPAAGLFLMTTPAYRHLLFRPGFWVMTGIAALSCIPILVWNVQHEWATFHHVGGQAGILETPGMRWLGPLSYVGMQCAILLVYWFVAWAAAMIAHRPGREADPGVLYLWWMSAVMFGVFFAFSIKSEEEPNWPVTAYLSGMVLMVPWLGRQFQSPSRWHRRWTAVGLTTSCVLGLALSLMMYHSDWLQPMLLSISGQPTPENPIPLRKFDPTCRLRGWRMLATTVDEVRAQLRAEQIEPVLAGSTWTLPGELAFYCSGHPTVHNLGPALGDRRSQLDFWRPNPVWDPEQFKDCTMIFVGDVPAEIHKAFQRVEPSRLVTYRERGEPVAWWQVTVCRGFRGFPDLQQTLPTVGH